jgi:uncharacterized small protein (DUF1192 family)
MEQEGSQVEQKPSHAGRDLDGATTRAWSTRRGGLGDSVRSRVPLLGILVGLFVGLVAIGDVRAADDERIEVLEQKLEELTREIERMKTSPPEGDASAGSPPVADSETAEPRVAESAKGEARVDELEEKVDVLTEELGRLESIFVVPEEIALESFSGLGPAASKVYKRDRGLSIGGYGEIRLRRFENKEDDDRGDVFDGLRQVLYVGYKFNENWVFNSELEFEHAGTSGGGSVSTEFATIDFLWRDELNARAGVVLVPMGFVNEIHEPTFFFGAERPEVERQILPSTWRETGGGIFGTVADRVHYRAYVINGFDGSGFDSGGLRGGRQNASRAVSNDFVGRVDVDAAPGLLVGGSVYVGQSGQEQSFTSAIDSEIAGASVTRDLPDALTTIYELHAQYKGYGLSLRGLWTEAFIDEAGNLSRTLDRGFENVGGVRTLTDPGQSIAQRMRGWYVEAAYDVMPLLKPGTRMSLEPYVRWEDFDTQHEVASGFRRNQARDIELLVAGIQFKPIPQIVFKLDFRHFDPDGGDRADEIQGLVGYVF